MTMWRQDPNAGLGGLGFGGQTWTNVLPASAPPVASVVSDIKRRIAELETQLASVDVARDELARLKRMLTAYETKEGT